MLNINLSHYKYSTEAIGDFLKASKVKFNWEFRIDDIPHKIELIHSRLKGKRKVIVDGNEISQTKKFSLKFSFNFPIGNHFFAINQVDMDKYNLTIDNIEIGYLNYTIKNNEFLHKNDNFYIYEM